MPTTIYLTHSDCGADGIDITYTKSRNVLRIGGWYDGMVGIESHEMGLSEFLRQLAIPSRQIEKALREVQEREQQEATR